MDNKALNVHRNYLKQLKLTHTMVYTGNSFSLAYVSYQRDISFTLKSVSVKFSFWLKEIVLMVTSGQRCAIDGSRDYGCGLFVFNLLDFSFAYFVLKLNHCV